MATNFSVLVGVLPYLRDLSTDMKEATIKRAMEALRNRTLTPDLAYALWVEVWAAEEVYRRVDKRVKMTATEVKANG